MSWIAYTLLATSSWAIVNIIDKYTLSNLVRNPLAPIVVLGFVGLIISVPILLLEGSQSISFETIFLSMLAGAIYLLVMYFYYQAVKIEEISKVIPLYYLSPIFVLIGSWIFLAEHLIFKQIVAVLLLVFGAIIISLNRNSKMGVSRALLYMLLAAVSYSGNQILTKYLLESNTFWTVFSYGRIGLFVTLLFVMVMNRQAIRDCVQQLNAKSVSIMISNQVLNVFGVFLITLALTNNYASLVNGLASIQPALVFIISTLLSIFYPRLIKENVKYSELGRKGIGIAVILLGTILVS